MTVLQFVVGFLVVVAASYVGTTLALRGYFGREYRETAADRGRREQAVEQSETE